MLIQTTHEHYLFINNLKSPERGRRKIKKYYVEKINNESRVQSSQSPPRQDGDEQGTLDPRGRLPKQEFSRSDELKTIFNQLIY